MSSTLDVMSAGDLAMQIDLPFWMKCSDLFLVHRGDAYLGENFFLDWGQEWETGEIAARWSKCSSLEGNERAKLISGVLVLGNLRVQGDIVNANGDGGPHLIVAGNLEARNLVCGGAFVEVKGDAKISETVFAHYNHGELRIWGNLDTRLLINDDHSVSIEIKKNLAGKTDKGKFGKGSYKYVDLKKLAKSEDDDGLPRQIKLLVSQKLLTWSDLRAKLFSGESIMRIEGEAPPSTIKEWVNIVWNNFGSLRKLPKDLRVEAFYLALFAKESRLTELEVMEAISMIPKAALTQNVRVAALELSPKSLLRLPTSFDLQSEYEQCFMQVKEPERVYEGIPAQYRTALMESRVADGKD